jgi:hypothetical protein
MQAASLRRRAEHARRLAKEARDSLEKIGYLQIAEEYERQANTLDIAMRLE